MTYKEMAIEKLFKDNVCDTDVSIVLLKLNDILKDVRFVDEQFLHEHIKPVLTKKALWFMRDNGSLSMMFETEEGIRFADAQDVVDVFSLFLDDKRLSEKQVNGLKIWTMKLIKPFAKTWKQRILKLASDLKSGIQR